MARRAGPRLRLRQRYAEIAGTDHPGIRIVHAEKQWMRRYFTALAAEAGLADPEVLGTELRLLYEAPR